jgi:membrane associated rhomboid family serine protease
MIPIRDDAPRAVTPYVTYSLIALNALLFLFELSLPPFQLNRFLSEFGLVPAQFTANPAAGMVTLFTSMFLHGSPMHLIANMWALYLFGDNIEDYLGSFKYLLLYFTGGIFAGLVQVFFDPTSQAPMVGASGAIAAVMGAYFLLFPAARVLTIFPPIWFFWLPAWLVLGYWFLAQFVSGAAVTIARTANTARESGGIAFWAHVGGFIAGLTLIKIFQPRAQRYISDQYD